VRHTSSIFSVRFENSLKNKGTFSFKLRVRFREERRASFPFILQM
jgi:hypothetical protein